MSRRRFEDLARLRSEIEGYAASLAAIRIDADIIKQVSEVDRAMVEAGEVRERDRYISHDQHFNFTI